MTVHYLINHFFYYYRTHQEHPLLQLYACKENKRQNKQQIHKSCFFNFIKI